MNAPILVMAVSPTCGPGWGGVLGAKPPPGATVALSYVVPELVPLVAPELTDEQRVAMEACLPPEGYVPDRTEEAGVPSRHKRTRLRFFGFWFSAAAINFVRAHHPGVRWASDCADGVGPVCAADMIHGWVGSRCVATVMRMRPQEGQEGDGHVD